MQVILYSRPGCHLCAVAQRLLEAHDLQPEVVNIDDAPALRVKFDTCVPVVEIDGKIRFRGRVEPVLLKRLLQK